MIRPVLTMIGVVVLARAAVAADLVATEKPLARLSLPIIPDSMTISPDSGRLVFATKAEPTAPPAIPGSGTGAAPEGVPGRTPIRYSIDGKFGGVYEILTPVMFSPDSTHVAWGGMKEGKWSLFLDERELVNDAEALPGGCVAYGPGGQIGWVCKRGDGFHVMQGEKAWGPIVASTLGMMSWSPDGAHLAALAKVKGSWVVLVDGTPLPVPQPTAMGDVLKGKAARTLDHFAGYAWWPDSGGILFRASYAFSRWQVFSEGVDGTVAYTSGLHENLWNGQPVQSRDGKHFAYGAVQQGKWTVVTDSGESPAPPFEALRADGAAWVAAAEGSPAELVYLGQRAKQWQVYVNHQPVKDAAFEAVVEGAFGVSPDGKHWACAGRSKEKGIVVRDGAVSTYDEVGAGTFAWSPDSQHLAFAARSGKSWCMMVDGASSPAMTGIGAAPPAWSPDSGRIAFTGQQEKVWRLFVGRNAEAQSKPYDAFLRGSHVTWRGDGTIVTVGIAKGVAMRVEVKAP